jgi:pyruvate dehydrogenase E1 component beta subunit
MALIDGPSPTSFGLTKNYYYGAKDIFIKVNDIFNKKIDNADHLFAKDYPHDIPGDWFKGPF